MRHFAYTDNRGAVVFTSTLAEGQERPPAVAGLDFHEIAEPINGPHMLDAGRLVALPPQPSPHHTFDYTTKQWVDPRTEQTQWPVVRSQRNALLSASDWTQLPDVPLETKETWATYRQALRDVTLQPDPFNVVWPVRPDQHTGIS